MKFIVVSILACSSEHSNVLLWSQKGSSYKSLSEKWLILQKLYDLCSLQLPTFCLHQFAYLPPVNKQFHKFGFYEVV